MLLAFALCSLAFAQDAQMANERRIEATLLQLRNNSPVIALMWAKITKARPKIYVFSEAIPGGDFAHTRPIGQSEIEIRVDVDKILKADKALISILVHELVHANDIAEMGSDAFTKMCEEDKDLPWGERRLEKRAQHHAYIIEGYLVLQHPELGTSMPSPLPDQTTQAEDRPCRVRVMYRGTVEIVMRDGETIVIGSRSGHSSKAIYRDGTEPIATFSNDRDAEWMSRFMCQLCELANKHK